MKNIFLVGMPSSGKSTLGRQLAKAIGYKFVDMDELIERHENQTIPEIFKWNGENHFREVESKILKQFSPNQKLVIATGGGVPCFFDNMEWMNENGTTVYLQMEPAQLVSRLHNRQKRPLIRDMDDEQLLAFINMKLAERNPFYYKAKLIVNSFDLDAETLEQKIFQQ